MIVSLPLSAQFWRESDLPIPEPEQEIYDSALGQHQARARVANNNRHGVGGGAGRSGGVP